MLLSRLALFSSCTPYLYSVLICHFALPRESSHSRRIIDVFVARPLLLLSRCSPVFTERFASHLRRVATLSAVRRSVFAFNRISLLNVETLHYLLSRRASRARSYSRVASVFISVDFHCCSNRHPGSRIPQSKSDRLCYSLLANTTRSASFRSYRVDSPPRR